MGEGVNSLEVMFDIVLDIMYFNKASLPRGAIYLHHLEVGQRAYGLGEEVARGRGCGRAVLGHSLHVSRPVVELARLAQFSWTLPKLDHLAAAKLRLFGHVECALGALLLVGRAGGAAGVGGWAGGHAGVAG